MIHIGFFKQKYTLVQTCALVTFKPHLEFTEAYICQEFFEAYSCQSGKIMVQVTQK